MQCSNVQSTVAIRTEIVAIETLDVDGQHIDTTRMRSASTVTGNVRGTTTYDQWVSRANGLIIRRIVDVDTNADSPLGNAHYTEHSQIDLVSLTPRT
jgi:hypothetical protein